MNILKKLITEVQIQKGNKERVNIYADNEYLFSCSTHMVFAHHIEKGKTIELEDIKQIIHQDNYEKCKDAALRTIEKYYKTEKEIKDRLLLKGYDEITIDDVMSFLREYNFTNDDKYVEMYIKDKIGVHGKKKIYYNLLSKGISEEIIKEKLDLTSTDEEKKGIMALCEKKYNTLIHSKDASDSRKLYRKLCSFLLSKGFDYEMVKDVVNKKLKEE